MSVSTHGWVVVGTWVSFQDPQADNNTLYGYVFDITPCGRPAILVPFDDHDDIHIVEPDDVTGAFHHTEMHLAIEVLTPADIDSITFDKAERQLRIDVVRTRLEEEDAS